jgi:ubiquinol-cytochrome c reductase cytochrome c subunit
METSSKVPGRPRASFCLRHSAVPTESSWSELFRLNCASCHDFRGRDGGPQKLPKFSDRHLAPDEKEDIAYIKSVTTGNNNPGGDPLGGIGPVSGGLVASIVGIAAWSASQLGLGAKS